MMRRVSWFIGGVATGVAGVGYTKRKIRTTFQRNTQFAGPITVTRAAGGAARATRRGATVVVDAVREGRQAMRAKEFELRARRDMTAEGIEDRLDEGDQLLVDGEPVDLARVVVLRPRSEAERQARRWRRRTS